MDRKDASHFMSLGLSFQDNILSSSSFMRVMLPTTCLAGRPCLRSGVSKPWSFPAVQTTSRIVAVSQDETIRLQEIWVAEGWPRQKWWNEDSENLPVVTNKMQTIFICLESKEAGKGPLMGTPGSGITFSFVTFRNLPTDLRLITANYAGPPVSPVFCSNKDWKARGTPRLNHELSLAESQSSQLPELIIELGVAGARPLWYKKILWKAKEGRQQ